VDQLRKALNRGTADEHRPQSITITLAPIEGQEGQISVVELRAPTMGNYRRFGEPASVAVTPDGAQVLVENKETIAVTMELCVIRPDIALIDAQASIADARRIREAILVFSATARPQRARPERPRRRITV
jgi:hypothetical protein